MSCTRSGADEPSLQIGPSGTASVSSFRKRFRRALLQPATPPSRYESYSCYWSHCSSIPLTQALSSDDVFPKRHLLNIEQWSQNSGSNVIPKRARPGLAGLRLHTLQPTSHCWRCLERKLHTHCDCPPLVHFETPSEMCLYSKVYEP